MVCVVGQKARLGYVLFLFLCNFLQEFIIILHNIHRKKGKTENWMKELAKTMYGVIEYAKIVGAKKKENPAKMKKKRAKTKIVLAYLSVFCYNS